MTITLDKPAVKTFSESDTNLLTAMRNAVIEKGADYVYEQRVFINDCGTESTECDYIRNGAASCLVGHGLLAGNLMTDTEIMLVEGTAAYQVLENRVSYDVAQAAQEAQRHQDTGETWGYAWNACLRELSQRGYPTRDLRL